MTKPFSNVDNLPDVNLALNLVGFDATLEDVQRFVSLFSSAEITEGDVEFERQRMQERDPGKSYYKKADRLFQFAFFYYFKHRKGVTLYVRRFVE